MKLSSEVADHYTRDSALKFQREIAFSGKSTLKSSKLRGNAVKSGQFSPLSFLPLNVFYQLKRHPMGWYLFLSCLLLAPFTLERSSI